MENKMYIRGSGLIANKSEDNQCNSEVSLTAWTEAHIDVKQSLIQGKHFDISHLPLCKQLELHSSELGGRKASS